MKYCSFGKMKLYVFGRNINYVLALNESYSKLVITIFQDLKQNKMRGGC
mgnify:FL=1